MKIPAKREKTLKREENQGESEKGENAGEDSSENSSGENKSEENKFEENKDENGSGNKGSEQSGTEEANSSEGSKSTVKENSEAKKGTYKLTYSVDPDEGAKVEGPSSIAAGKKCCVYCRSAGRLCDQKMFPVKVLRFLQ